MVQQSRSFPSVVARVALTLIASALIVACGSNKKQKFAYVESPVETLYQNAVDDLEKRRFERAIAFFEEVERQHPYSEWARRAMLMKAFALYESKDYEEAITAVDQFIALHPGNKDAAYAYYLKAMSFYDRIVDVGRDQALTNNAVGAFNDLVRRYPNTEYARDARLKLDLTSDHLAGKEMYVGRFYLKANQHVAAINRFKFVLENYQTTSHVPEALHRLVEAYLELGIGEEARSAASVLGHNFPGSTWYTSSYELLGKYGLDAPETGLGVARAPGDLAPDEQAYFASSDMAGVKATVVPANFKVEGDARVRQSEQAIATRSVLGTASPRTSLTTPTDLTAPSSAPSSAASFTAPIYAPNRVEPADAAPSAGETDEIADLIDQQADAVDGAETSSLGDDLDGAILKDDAMAEPAPRQPLTKDYPTDSHPCAGS